VAREVNDRAYPGRHAHGAQHLSTSRSASSACAGLNVTRSGVSPNPSELPRCRRAAPAALTAAGQPPKYEPTVLAAQARCICICTQSRHCLACAAGQRQQLGQGSAPPAHIAVHSSQRVQRQPFRAFGHDADAALTARAAPATVATQRAAATRTAGGEAGASRRARSATRPSSTSARCAEYESSAASTSASTRSSACGGRAACQAARSLPAQ